MNWILFIFVFLVVLGIVTFTGKMSIVRHYDEMRDLREMNTRFNFLIFDKPTMLTRAKSHERARCMQEELHEFIAAVEHGDMAEQADALIDLVVFAKGTAVMMGLPWEELWRDVMRANMSKIPGATARSATDLIKPKGWVPPQTTAILKSHDFYQEEWLTPEGDLEESYCADTHVAPINAVPKVGDVNV